MWPQVLSVADDPGPAVAAAVAALARGELVIVPTDTVYGLAAQPPAQARLYRAKGREPGKPIPVLAADLDAVAAAAARFSPAERRLAERFWPGPLTLVLKTGGQGGTEREEGFRVPAGAVIARLLREAGGLLRVTSANRSGEPPALCVAEALPALAPYVALALDAGPAPGGVASTVARASKDRVEILRPGALSEAQLRAAAFPGTARERCRP